MAVTRLLHGSADEKSLLASISIPKNIIGKLRWLGTQPCSSVGPYYPAQKFWGWPVQLSSLYVYSHYYEEEPHWSLLSRCSQTSYPVISAGSSMFILGADQRGLHPMLRTGGDLFLWWPRSKHGLMSAEQRELSSPKARPRWLYHWGKGDYSWSGEWIQKPERQIW